MQEHVKNLEFEAAGQIHNYIKSIEVSVQNQVVADSNIIDRDIQVFHIIMTIYVFKSFLSRLGNIIERKVEYFSLYDNPETNFIFLFNPILCV